MNIVMENRHYDVVLFDLEGTLVDFQWNLADASKTILNALEAAGIDSAQYGPNPDYARLFNQTKSVTQYWEEAQKTALFDRLEKIYQTYDSDALSRWQTNKGARDTLETLSGKGFRMGVVSNCGKAAVNAVLKKFHLLPYFELVLCRQDVDCVKPAPDGLLSALKIFDVPVEKAIFIGDSLNDIIPADQIRMPSCFLTGGESRITGDTDHRATFEISALSDLVEILA